MVGVCLNRNDEPDRRSQGIKLKDTQIRGGRSVLISIAHAHHVDAVLRLNLLGWYSKRLNQGEVMQPPHSADICCRTFASERLSQVDKVVPRHRLVGRASR